MTDRLYDNGMLMEFDAAVTSCTQIKKGYEVTLDRSAFFPEGGGQYGDVGTIAGVKVTDTYERGGEVIHLCDAPLEAGAQVHGAVDKDIRLRRMQNHSGEHLLMGFIHNMTGFDNVGFHLGEGEVILDLNGVIGAEQLLECERRANRAIAENVPFTISYPDENELAALDYRSKLDLTENVRIVTIEGIDKCACCAPHVQAAGQIGIIRVISSENYKGGTRLRILCGMDAFELIRQRMDSIREISALLSAKPDKTVQHVKRLSDENISLKKQLAELDRQKAQSVIDSLANEGRGSFCVFTEGISRDMMREIANSAVLMTDGAAGVFGREDGGYSYIIASKNLPLRTMAKDINSALDGRGGGSDEMIQGSAKADRSTIEAYFGNISAVTQQR